MLPRFAGLDEFIVIMLAILLIASLGVGILIKVSVWLYNLLAGNPESPYPVPPPDFVKAVTIAFVYCLINMINVYGVGSYMKMKAMVAPGGPANLPRAELRAQMIEFAISLTILVVTLTIVLPTTIGRALRIAFLYTAVTVLLALAGAVIWSALELAGLIGPV